MLGQIGEAGQGVDREEQIFLWDWPNLARQQTAFETSMPSVAGDDEAAPLNAVTVPWSTIFED